MCLPNLLGVPEEVATSRDVDPHSDAHPFQRERGHDQGLTTQTFDFTYKIAIDAYPSSSSAHFTAAAESELRDKKKGVLTFRIEGRSVPSERSERSERAPPEKSPVEKSDGARPRAKRRRGRVLLLPLLLPRMKQNPGSTRCSRSWRLILRELESSSGCVVAEKFMPEISNETFSTKWPPGPHRCCRPNMPISRQGRQGQIQHVSLGALLFRRKAWQKPSSVCLD